MRTIKLTPAAIAFLIATLATTISQAGSAILLEFSSPHCPPCQAMKPLLDRLERSGVPIRHVDVVSEPHLASRYNIRKTPTFIVINDGKEVKRLIGMQSLANLQTALATNPAGPLVATRSSVTEIDVPQTRLAPIHPSDSALPDHSIEPVAPPMNVTSASSRGESMPSLSVADAIQRAQAATVRLRVYDGRGHGAGTGTIIDTHGDEALVLTCGHLFRETKGQGKIEVDLFVGGQVKTVLGQVIDYDAETRDIALVSIRPGMQIDPVQVISDRAKVANGTVAFSFGCDRGDDPSRRDTRITGVNKYDQHLGVSNLEIEGAPIDGRSGGGLFDEQGRLIGVCNAADYKNDVGIYAGPGTVHWQLDRVNLAQLYQQRDDAITAAPNAPSANADPVARLASTVPIRGLPDTAPAAPQTQAIDSDQEVIVIVRQRGNPSSSKVLTLLQPSPDLMQMIQRNAR